jgi:hypothetical protein
MIIYQDKFYVPIGSSCINQFEIRRRAESFGQSYVSKSSFFDWIIITPTSTIQLLHLIFEGRHHKIFSDFSYYSIINDKLVHKYFEGLIFYHEKAEIILNDSDKFDDFKMKTIHQLDNFVNFTVGKSPVFIWSNCQPNLRHEMRNFPTEISQSFSLTRRVHEHLLSILNKIFTDDFKCYFISRSSDLDKSIESEYLIVLDIPEITNYDGLSNLFPEPVMAKIFTQ